MIYRTQEGNTYSLDFREKAPIKSSKDMYLDSVGNIINGLSTYGKLSIGVPGTISGIFEAHEKFGSLSIEDIFNPAIELAKNGFSINKIQAKLLNAYKDDFIKLNPNNNYFVKTKNWETGDILVQTDLAKTLTIIKNHGCKSFYNGVLTSKILSSLGTESILSKDDFLNYQSIWRDPIVTNINEYKIISMPPPSSGGIALSQLLIMIFNSDLQSLKHNSVKYIHLYLSHKKIKEI